MKDIELLFKRFYMPLGMYALSIIKDVEEAEDIVQQVFYTIIEQNKRIEISNSKIYLYRAVRNESISRLRLSSRLLPIEEIPEISAETINTAERDARLWRKIEHLPNRCRQVFLLSKRDGLSNKEIAEELGISVKTVENQMTKAFKLLRSEVKESHFTIFFLPFMI